MQAALLWGLRCCWAVLRQLEGAQSMAALRQDPPRGSPGPCGHASTLLEASVWEKHMMRCLLFVHCNQGFRKHSLSEGQQSLRGS